MLCMQIWKFIYISRKIRRIKYEKNDVESNKDRIF